MSTKGVWADYQKTMVISGNNLFVCIYVKQLHMISKQIKFHHHNQIEGNLLQREYGRVTTKLW